MIHEQLLTISMRSNVREWTRGLFVKHTVFVPAQLLRSWHEQRPGIYGGLDLNRHGEFWKSLLHWDKPDSDFIFVPL